MNTPKQPRQTRDVEPRATNGAKTGGGSGSRIADIRCPSCGGELVDLPAEAKVGGEHLESLVLWAECAGGHRLTVTWRKPRKDRPGEVGAVLR